MWLKVNKDTAYFIPSEQPLIMQVTREGLILHGSGLQTVYFCRDVAIQLDKKTDIEMVDFIGCFLEEFSERTFVDPSVLAAEVLEVL